MIISLGIEAACSRKSYGGFLDSWLTQIKSIYDINYEKIKLLLNYTINLIRF